MALIEGEFASARADGVVYLNTAGMSLLPNSILALGEDALRRKATPWKGLYGDASGLIRERYGKLINSPPTNITFSQSTAHAMSMVAHNLAAEPSLRPNSKVIVLAQQMASNVVPWQRLCRLRQLRLVVIPEPPLDSAESWADRIVPVIDGDTALVALPAVHWCTGARVDLSRVSAAIHRLGSPSSRAASPTSPAAAATHTASTAPPPATHEADQSAGSIRRSPPSAPSFSRGRPLFVIDGTQSIGADPLDVAALKPDVVTCSVQKWLCSPYGASLVYVAPWLHGQWVGLEHHERNRAGSDHPDYDAVGAMGATGYPDVYMDGARRFDPAGRPNPVTLPMIAAALGLVLKWTPEAVQRHCAGLAGLLRTELGSIRTADGHLAYVWDPHGCGHIVGIRPSAALQRAGVTALTLGKELAAQSIVLSVRAMGLRVSFWLYNDAEDVARLVKALRTAVPAHGATARL